MRRYGMHIHVWRPVDSQFRLITARRNPNMVILVASLADRPARHGPRAGRAVDDRFADLPRGPPGPGQCRRRARPDARQLAGMTRWTALLLAGSRPGRRPVRGPLRRRAEGADPGRRRADGAAAAAAPCSASKRIEAVRVLTPGARQDRRRPARSIRGWSVEPSGGTIAATLEAICSATVGTLAAAGDDRRPCAARRGDDRPVLRRGGRRRSRHRRGRRKSALEKRLPQSRRTWLGFRRGKYTGANLFAFGIAQGAEGGRAVARGRAGPQEGLAAACWRSAGRACSALLRLRTLDQTLDAMGRKLGLTLRAVRLDDPLAAVDVDKPQDHELVTAILERRGMTDLAIYDMDRTRHAARDLHAVPAALRAAAGAVAAAVPAVRRSLSMLAYVAEADRPRAAEGNQPPPAARPQRHPHELKPLVESFAEATVASNIRPGAREAIARDKAEGRRVVMATASYRLYADAIGRAARLRRRHRHRLDHRPRRARPRQDRRRELLRPGQAPHGHRLARQERPRARPRPLLLRPRQRRAGVRMGRRSGRGEPARPAGAAGERRGLGLECLPAKAGERASDAWLDG